MPLTFRGCLLTKQICLNTAFKTKNVIIVIKPILVPADN